MAQVAAGVGHMLFLVDAESDTVKQLEEFEPEIEVEPSKGEAEVAEAANGKGSTAGLLRHGNAKYGHTLLVRHT